MAVADELRKRNLKELRAIVKKYNADVMIKRYSTMKKADLIEAMMKKEVMKKIKDAPELKPAAKPAAKPKKSPAPEQGPRNLKKGFGIKRMPAKPKAAEPEEEDTDDEDIDALFRLNPITTKILNQYDEIEKMTKKLPRNDDEFLKLADKVEKLEKQIKKKIKENDRLYLFGSGPDKEAIIEATIKMNKIFKKVGKRQAALIEKARDKAIKKKSVPEAIELDLKTMKPKRR